MIDNLIVQSGGYGSWGFWLLLIALVLGGSILAKVVNPFFTLLIIAGVVLLTKYISFTVTTTLGMPSWSNYLPIAFVVTVLVGIGWGMHKASKQEKTNG